jgi:hypothetical protein
MAVAEAVPPVADLTAFPYRFEIIDLHETFADEKYQRGLTSLAEEIADQFNPALVGTIILSERTGHKRDAPFGPAKEKYAVVDGQTRRAGALKAGVDQLPALVYEGMTRAQEASLFALLQRKRRNMMTHERFKAALVAGEAEAVGIDKIVRQLGYTVDRRGEGKTIQATAALEAVYRWDPQLLTRVVRILDTAWGANATHRNDAFGAEIIRGLARFIRDMENTNRQEVDDRRMIERLRRTSPADLRIQSGHLRQGRGGGGSTAIYMAEVLLGVYRSR